MGMLPSARWRRIKKRCAPCGTHREGAKKNARDFTRTGDLFQTVSLGTEAVDLGFVGGEDDIDVADVAEIGAEHDIEAIALAVGRIGDTVHATDEDAGGGRRRSSRRFR